MLSQRKINILTGIVLVLFGVGLLKMESGNYGLCRRINNVESELHCPLDLNLLGSCGIITDGYGHGSCVAIGPNLILTAGHCLDHPGCWIEMGGASYEIISTWRSSVYDIGLIVIREEVTPVSFGDMPARLDEVYKVGYPISPKLENCIAKGIISQVGVTFYMWSDILIMDSPGIGGQSGGVVFDRNNKLVAIHVGHVSYGFGVEEPITHIVKALEEYYNAGLEGHKNVGPEQGD